VLLLCQLHEQVMRELAADPRFVIAAGPGDAPRQGIEAVRTLVVRSNVHVDRDLLDRLPKLERVLRAGSGTDNIDLPLLRARGIELHRYPDVSADAVAELGMAALVLLARQVPLAHWCNRLGRFCKHALWGEPVAGLDVAIWGAGSVGKAAHASLRQLCRSVAFVEHTTRLPGLPYRPHAELLERADAHLLCVPLRPTTHRLFDDAMLRSLAPARPYVVNLGRYELLDLSAAVQSLRHGRLRGVFVEPIDGQHLREVTALLAGDEPVNLLTSQHLGGQRVDVHERLRDWILLTVRDQHTDRRADEYGA
jgi:D-3-phosphoglycerate dehydrogenase